MGTSKNSAVVKIVAVKALRSRKVQQLSTSGLQQVQQQSLRNFEFP
jgi:hypothetical protein